MKLKEVRMPKCPKCKNKLVVIGALSFKNILIRRQYFCWYCEKQYIDEDEGKELQKIIKILNKKMKNENGKL